MSLFDIRGLPVTASRQASVEALDAAVASYLGARRSTNSEVTALVETDPECVLGWCLRGYVSMHSGEPRGISSAKKSHDHAVLATQSRPATQRERMHISALRAWSEGDYTGSAGHWNAIAREWPRDLLAVRLAQFMTSYLGDTNGIRDCVACVLPAWDDRVPGYGFLLGCYAYGLEECGEYASAERIGRLAVESNPSDLWGAHAVAHVMEMEGRPREGISWIAGLEAGWRECSNFVLHVEWHRCLFHLALREFDRVLELYDSRMRIESTSEYLDIANAAALLWRLEQQGANVGNRWEELANRSEEHIDDHVFPLADVHYMLALAAKREQSAAEKFLRSCSLFAETGQGTAAAVMKQVGVSLVEAILAHRGGDHQRVLALLLPQRHLLRRIGGSHAQRDVFEQLLIDSAVRSGERHSSYSLLTERLERRPHDFWTRRTLADYESRC